MRISEQRKQEIIAAFQRSFKQEDRNAAEIATFTLDELGQVDEMLGPRDREAGYRIAMRNRVSDLELEEQRHHESRVRAGNYIMGIVTGLLIAGLAVWLFG